MGKCARRDLLGHPARRGLSSRDLFRQRLFVCHSFADAVAAEPQLVAQFQHLISHFDAELTVARAAVVEHLRVAGTRAGLAGARSGLFMEQIRVVKEMRNAERRKYGTDQPVHPRFFGWENVPGATCDPIVNSCQWKAADAIEKTS